MTVGAGETVEQVPGAFEAPGTSDLLEGLACKKSTWMSVVSTDRLTIKRRNEFALKQKLFWRYYNVPHRDDGDGSVV